MLSACQPPSLLRALQRKKTRNKCMHSLSLSFFHFSLCVRVCSLLCLYAFACLCQVLGACMFHVSCGGESVLYTGDYNMTPDRFLMLFVFCLSFTL